MCEHMLSPYQNMYRTLRSLWVHLHVCFNLVTTTTSANLFSLNLIFPQCYLHFGLWCPFMSVWIYDWNNLEEKQKSINLLKRSLCEQWAWNNHIYSSWLTVWSLVYFVDMKFFYSLIEIKYRLANISLRVFIWYALIFHADCGKPHSLSPTTYNYFMGNDGLTPSIDK